MRFREFGGRFQRFSFSDPEGNFFVMAKLESTEKVDERETEDENLDH